MNLRQIVRNQKLQNFNYNLSDFITEADDEKVEKKDAFAGKSDAKEPKDKYWYVKDGDYKARVNHPGEGWELADKKKAEKAEKEKEGKDTSDEMSVEERKERADDFAAGLDLKPAGKDKDVYVDEDGKPVLGFADDGTVLALDIEDQNEKKWEKAISDFNDSTGAVPEPEQSIDLTPEVTEADVEATQKNIENAGEPYIKDKSLGKITEEGEDVFSATIPPAIPEEQFLDNMNTAPNKTTPAKSVRILPDDPFSFDEDQIEKFFSKVPKVYAPVIERMLNQTIGKSSITDFMQGVGAGQPPSQAGEIITMAAITMSDEDADDFFEMLSNRVNQEGYPPPPKGQAGWISDSWVESARDVRNGTIARYNGAYGEGNWEIDKGCWDSATEVEAMGLKDYAKNKGFSTDTYMRLNVDGKPILDEISLKKDLNVNFLNKNTTALIDFAILGSDEAGLYEQLNDLWAKIDEKDRDKKDPPTFDVEGESLTPREIQAKINEMKANAFDKLAESNPELADQIKLADADRAKIRQRELLGDSLGSEEFLMSMAAAAEDFEEIKNKEPLHTILNGLVGGGKSRKDIDDYARESVALLVPENKLKGVTFGKDEEGNTLDPMVVYKDGVELKTPAAKQAIFGKGNSASDRIQKLAWYATVLGSAKNRTLNKHRKSIEENIKEHTDAVIRTINDIPQMKSGMLNAIREEFPLKALFEGEEAMSLAQYNCDPKVLKEIFEGAESYEDIQDKLGIEEDETGELSLVYRASAGGESIPVASLDARSDGKGYGNSFKFTLKVHRGFKDALKDGNATVYEGSGVYPPPSRTEESINLDNLGNILAEDEQNTLAFHWKKAEDDYPLHYFLRDLNEGSLK